MIAKLVPMSSALACLLLLGACPSEPPTPSDDDDATDAPDDDDSADDDDVADDDDSATHPDDDDATDDDDFTDVEFLCPDGETVDPLDLSDGTEFVRTTFALAQMRYLGEILRFGLASAEPNCPTWAGDHPASPGTTVWSGGCTTDGGGVGYEGELTQVRTSAEGSSTTVSTAKAWSSAGAGDYDSLAFSGTWTASEGDGGIWRDDTSAGELQLVGVPNSPIDAAMPQGVVGSYDWTGDWTAPPSEVHTFDFAGTVRCRGPVLASLTLGESGNCFGSNPDSGTAVIEAFGDVATIDFSDDDSCSGCWPWSLNGEVQDDVVCSFDR